MGKFCGIKIVSKVEVKTKEELAVVYTPGVAASCLKIKENPECSYDYTNRENSVAVISFDYEKSLTRAIFLKSTSKRMQMLLAVWFRVRTGMTIVLVFPAKR